MENVVLTAVCDFNSGMTYDEYYSYVEVESENPSTEVNVRYQQYIRQNIARMKRLTRKKVDPDKNLLTDSELNRKIYIVVLTEAWCGDASQIVPVAYNFFKNFPFAEFRCFLRDENPELMDHFLTNNTRSIPIIALFDENMSLSGYWGPRPKAAQELYQSLRKAELPMDELVYQLHKWYADDKSASTINELQQMILSLFRSAYAGL